ncbi:cytochrome c oxidase subunit II [Halapricum salinum]|uniref:cytochrome-c oxidase n=1 Tax=Halapricum salinum TaxID=1457250 RepID=A0A4D6HH40_9EURY|nr:cytochrome c oxidase subunit II [Halapricum salinum]QCC52518.1 cytochrome c oxidase subunit II [Halapricum salinum]
MNRNRAGLVALLSGVLVTLASQPALAQSTSDSSTEELVWGLNFELLAVAIPITILVEAILLYTVWRFRDGNVESAKPTVENRRLEITWTVATAIILLFVGIGSYGVMAADDGGSAASAATPSDEQVQVNAFQFNWEFHYPEYNVTSYDELVIPADRSVKFNVSSRNVIHAFHVPELALKTDAMPGGSNYLLTTPQNPGTYQLYCAEYCGSGHSQMTKTVRVLPSEEFDDWIQSQQNASE